MDFLNVFLKKEPQKWLSKISKFYIGFLILSIWESEIPIND